MNFPLSKTHPELAREAWGWDPSKPVLNWSLEKNWKCNLDHVYQATVSARTSRNRGCPYCAGQKVLAGFNDFAFHHPDLAKEAVGWDPTTISKSSSRKLLWKCENSHQYEAVVYSRAKGKGCPFCSGRKVLTGFNDLATTHPEIAAEAHNWNPTTVSKGSNQAQEWKCAKEHIWRVSTNKRTSQNSGCPICSNSKVLIGFNDLATTHPDVADEIVDADPTNYVSGSEAKLAWRCALGHIFISSVTNRTRGSGCTICSGKQVLSGFNDLASLFPAIAREAHGWDPTSVTAFTQKKLEWKCAEGHIFSRQVSNRTTRENRCPICSGHQVLPGFNDLATTHPQVASQALGWNAKAVTAGSARKVSWLCQEGHSFQAQIINRTFRGDKCPICSGKEVLFGFNDLGTTHPELSSQLSNPELARQVSSGSDKRLEWICSEGHKWKTSVANRKAGNGCPTCAKSGFDPNSKAFLYFLIHDQWEMFQIGITNYPSDRLKVHQNLGWKPIEVMGPMDGHSTQVWETAILRMLKAHGADLSNEKIAGKFDGYSEAWSQATFSAKSLKELMRITELFEEKNTSRFD